MKPIDVAVKLIKGLREQQGFMMSGQLPTLYGQDMTDRSETPPFLSLQQRRGTIHPAILGMMERRQTNAGYMPFPDRRLRFGSDNNYGTIMAQGPMNEMTAPDSDNDLTDDAQRKRGSVFDSGYYNPYGLPMVGVRQPNYKERRMPRNPELNRIAYQTGRRY